MVFGVAGFLGALRILHFGGGHPLAVFGILQRYFRFFQVVLELIPLLGEGIDRKLCQLISFFHLVALFDINLFQNPGRVKILWGPVDGQYARSVDTGRDVAARDGIFAQQGFLFFRVSRVNGRDVPGDQQGRCSNNDDCRDLFFRFAFWFHILPPSVFYMSSYIKCGFVTVKFLTK